MSSQARIAAIVAVLVVAVGGFVLAAGSGDDNGNDNTTASEVSDAAKTGTGTTEDEATEGSENREQSETTPAPDERVPATTITVQNGEPVDGVKKIEVDKGDRVRLVVQSDVADEIHVHGYDLTKDVEAGGTARFDFKASIDGSFEIELEDRGAQIASLTVQP